MQLRQFMVYYAKSLEINIFVTEMIIDYECYDKFLENLCCSSKF